MSGVRWKQRGSYGRMLHKTIKKLQTRFEKEQDHDKSIALAKSLGYLVSVQRKMIIRQSIPSYYVTGGKIHA